jgi:GH43 family beta-xylosidase
MLRPLIRLHTFCIVLAFASKPALAESKTFFNPILPYGKDPWMVQHEGSYYFIQSIRERAIHVWKSKGITSLRSATRWVVWEPPAKGPGSQHVWAPEMHYLRGKWYIYYAADAGENAQHRMYVLESQSDDPLGPYTSKGKILEPSDKWAIDGTVFEHADGQLYFVWSGWSGNVDVQQNIYIAPMKDPWTLAGPRVLLTEPTLPWERTASTGPRIAEAPQVLARNGRLFIVYSADQSWTNNYKLGMLSFQGGDVLDRANWRKSRRPVFESTLSREGNVFGPGHSSFVMSADEQEHWIIFHAANRMDSGWDRNVHAQKFSWNKDGSPEFGRPVPTSIPLPLPSGEVVTPLPDYQLSDPIFNKWNELGRDVEILGFPLADEMPIATGEGKIAQFQGGIIVDLPGRKPYALHGMFYSRWLSQGGETGCLGYPLSDAYHGSHGSLQQDFQNGVVFYQDDQSVQAVCREAA